MIKTFYHQWASDTRALLTAAVGFLISIVSPLWLAVLLWIYGFGVLGIYWYGTMKDW